MAALVCALIEHGRIKTTLAKAKVARRLAEKMIGLARKGSLSARRQALAAISSRKHVAKVFGELVPKFEGRNGGYTRITRLNRRQGDGAETVYLEWVIIDTPVKKKRKNKAEKAETK
jgi:large subunit ribosomal protein L17